MAQATKDWSEKYNGYMIRHTPLPAPGGRLAPYLTIEGGKGTKSTTTVHFEKIDGPDSYATEEEAAAAALAAGKKWVDING